MDDSAREQATSVATAMLGQMKREVFDGSRIAVIQRDLDNHVLYANAAALKLSGAPSREAMRLDQLFRGEAAQVLEAETRGRRNRELGAYSVTLTRLDAPHRQIAVEVTGVPLMDAQGTVVGSLGFFRSLEFQALTDQLRRLTLSHAGRADLLPKMAEALREELPFDLMLVSRVVADADSWESEIVFNHPPFQQNVPRAWYGLNGAQRAYMEASHGGIHGFEAALSQPPWSDMANEPLCLQMREMALKASMWRRISRSDGEVERTVAIITLLSRQEDAYDEDDQKLFNQLPLVETVLCALDHEERRRDRRELRMFRELNRCADIQSACSCLAASLIEIFNWGHVSLFRVDSARESIVRVASARLGEDGLAIDTGTVWGDYSQGIGQGILGRVVASMQAKNIPDVTLNPDYLKSPDGEPIRSELAMPIVFSDRERVRFIVNVDDPRVNAFSQEHVLQLQDIAHEVAGAMQRISDLTLLAECVDNVSDPIIATDAKLRIRRVNRAAESLFGASRQALEGRNLIPLFQNPRQLEALLDGTQVGDRLGELKVCRRASEDRRQGEAGADSAPTSVFITRRDFPGKLGGHVFIAQDLQPIRRSVQLEFLEETAYELAVETQAPLGMAMSYLESQLEASHRPGVAKDPARAQDLQSVLRQVGRVKHAFTRLALYNREARVASRVLRTFQLDSELEALLASLAASERAKVELEPSLERPIEIEADHMQLHIVIESLLSVLLRAAPETSKVRLTLAPDGPAVFLRLRGKLPPARRYGARFGASEGAAADLRLANPLVDKLMKNQGGSLKVNLLSDGYTEFVLGFSRGRAHG